MKEKRRISFVVETTAWHHGQSGLKRKNNIHLSQKRTCGRIDSGAGVYGGCYAYDDSHDYCQLKFKCEKGIPLEPCLKPKTEMQWYQAMKLRGLLKLGY